MSERSTTSATEQYILDTNVLVGFSHWLPMEYHPDFWKKLRQALEDGKWILLEEVIDEVKYPEDLKKWCKAAKSAKLTVKLSEEEYFRAVEINNLYPMIDQDTFKSTVDTQIIALAESRGFSVFSQESKRIDEAKPHKIPDVCILLKLKCIKRIKIFLKNIGYRP